MTGAPMDLAMTSSVGAPAGTPVAGRSATSATAATARAAMVVIKTRLGNRSPPGGLARERLSQARAQQPGHRAVTSTRSNTRGENEM